MATDFTTALARLLRDSQLRAEFCQDAAGVADRLGVTPALERAAFVQLIPSELEAQARVLVRKRFREVETCLPITCGAHEARGWRHFVDFARSGGWPQDAAADALAFCEWLRTERRLVNRQEMNRVRFDVRRRRFAVHLVIGPGQTEGAWGLPRAQVLFRRQSGKVSEMGLRLGW